ncbi:hypothetical protein P153DRAFT_390933 [Dothidotthia symphoricarpi CBS 119687]|uniref:Uncharacterized protein n=1 Tax=Dothidotthia symphoricarpi CBS 119687 TaxID=1392245 RepID=A0A6A5ZZM3_9PLEO|nr:uncharacterized protein P153DRAFT_390933 [Dothidotthia symphoricarpi CBS 119687]KAF2123888.1 hypothetical protein P153DRAFT_390933 [Dothidotthia symphoricarpi CBS 119687]
MAAPLIGVPESGTLGTSALQDVRSRGPGPAQRRQAPCIKRVGKPFAAATWQPWRVLVVNCLGPPLSTGCQQRSVLAVNTTIRRHHAVSEMMAAQSQRASPWVIPRCAIGRRRCTSGATDRRACQDVLVDMSRSTSDSGAHRVACDSFLNNSGSQ